jgi:hypothetical protein
LPILFSEEHPLLTGFVRELLSSLYEELCALDQRIQAIATAIVAVVSDGNVFRNGRQFAAWIGLVPWT